MCVYIYVYVRAREYSEGETTVCGHLNSRETKWALHGRPSLLCYVLLPPFSSSSSSIRERAREREELLMGHSCDKSLSLFLLSKAVLLLFRFLFFRVLVLSLFLAALYFLINIVIVVINGATRGAVNLRWEWEIYRGGRTELILFLVAARSRPSLSLSFSLLLFSRDARLNGASD